jgi:hypothetical protein
MNSMGRKAYTKGSVIKWDVEIGSFSLDFLMSSLCSEVKWASNQSATVWFFDKRVGEDVKLSNEIQMLDLFDMYESEMSCQVIVTVFDTNKTAVVEQTFDNLEPLCALPPNDVVDNIPVDNGAHSEWNAHAVEPEREPDLFDNEEEYVGVDDEHMYIGVAPPQPTSPSSAQPADPSHENETDFGEHVAAAVEGDTEVNDADPQELNVINDPENPKIEVGSLFPNIVAFRKAIRHYDVKRGFEFKDLKTDKTRFIAKCAHKGCSWRIHASTIYDKKQLR